MRLMNLTLFASLWMFGALSTACAQSQEAPPPPQEEERRERIERLEVEIRDMERAMKDAPPERQEELRKRIHEKVAQLKEMRGGRPPQDGRHEKARRLEAQIRELQQQLEKKDLSPEKRKELTAKLDETHARMRELHDQGQREDPGWGTQRPGKGPGQDPLGRDPHQPFDPELHKIHQEAMELERESMKLSSKMRGLPQDNPERADMGAKLKEVVTRLFDLREQARAREVDLIKKRLEELTQLLAKRKANRDAIIEKRIKQLSGENDELDW